MSEAITKKRAKMIFITGGARSGKSRYAQELALQQSNTPIYVATARIWDADFRQRVDRHRHDRDERWSLLEEEKFLSRLSLAGKTAVIDCVTLWITNFFADLRADIDACLAACEQEIEGLLQQDAVLLVISNEIGMGMHADTEAGRKFTDLQGWVNQSLAAKADEVIFMVSGIPLKIK
ncbi:bifunctional adenosylcobinamide kinase/adenosylcobinamide-phosphate guanylyltransferase [Puia dinghuensis]|uniref:Adenosylcobinamide kinase n=1 Tax=Puia dinghuensis TaxID=1792502 RepID=A0A8J2UFD8_9BACT|nr:bifunctional adenosylcobinamide kinase/adenosylcobinamide-phosphate guanylyltransferase [Puia dinghuensis]GGB08025.1 cobinamide kinase [Puia dinghuensis]